MSITVGTCVRDKVRLKPRSPKKQLTAEFLPQASRDSQDGSAYGNCWISRTFRPQRWRAERAVGQWLRGPERPTGRRFIQRHVVPEGRGSDGGTARTCAGRGILTTGAYGPADGNGAHVWPSPPTTAVATFTIWRCHGPGPG